LIGKGYTAEVFRSGDEAVVKLFLPGVSPELIDREIAAGKYVFDQGLPVPEILDLVRVEDRTGIVFRHVSGETLLLSMQRQPQRIFSFAQQFAELHVGIHQIAAPVFAVQAEQFRSNITTAPGLSEPIRERLHERLDDLNTAELRLCHGDFHPDNVLMTANGPVIIDWMAASAGDPVADVARTLLVSETGVPIQKLSLRDRLLISSFRRLFANAYLNRYCRITRIAKPSVKNWDPIVAAARLNEDVGKAVTELQRRAGRH
jgi:aminoglycoside phosphotransferase (APT) family kinase protein